jgi:Electron transfer DM13
MVKQRMSLSGLLAIPIVAGVVALGVWVAGGLLTNDYRASMALTGLWFGATGLACLLIARRSRSLRVPVLASYLVTVALIGGYLGLSTLRDREADERIAGGTELASGGFRAAEHDTQGTAAVVRTAGGDRFLTLTGFETAAGPDLRVRLVPGDTTDGGADGALDLGALKGNRGDQQYRIPDDVSHEGRTVVIWCRAFSAPFGRARLA